MLIKKQLLLIPVTINYALPDSWLKRYEANICGVAARIDRKNITYSIRMELSCAYVVHGM